MRSFTVFHRGILRAAFGAFILLPSMVALGDWRDLSGQASLHNNIWDCTFQNGFPCVIKSKATGDTLIQIQPNQLPATQPLFGPSHSVSLDTGTVKQEADDKSVTAHWRMQDGAHLTLHWSI